MYYIKQRVLETCRKKRSRMIPTSNSPKYYQQSNAMHHFSRKTRRNDIHGQHREMNAIFTASSKGVTCQLRQSLEHFLSLMSATFTSDCSYTCTFDFQRFEMLLTRGETTSSMLSTLVAKIKRTHSLHTPIPAI